MTEPPAEYLWVDPQSCRHEWSHGKRGGYFWLQSQQFGFADFLLSWKPSPANGALVAVLQSGYEGSNDYFEKELHWTRISDDYCLSPPILDLESLSSGLEGDGFLIFPSSREITELIAAISKTADAIDLFQRANIILGPIEDEALDRFWKSLDVLAPTLYMIDTFIFTLITPDESIIQETINSTTFAGMEESLIKESIKRLRGAWEALGPETGPEHCVEPGCDRLRIKRAIRCFGHQLGVGAHVTHHSDQSPDDNL